MYWYLGWAALPCCTRDTCNLHWHIWRSWAAGQGSAKAEGVTGQWLCAHTHTPWHLCWHWEPATKDLGQISLHFPKVLQLYEKDWGTKKGPNFKCRNDVWRLLHRKNLCFCWFCFILEGRRLLESVRFTAKFLFWAFEEGQGTCFPEQLQKGRECFLCF